MATITLTTQELDIMLPLLMSRCSKETLSNMFYEACDKGHVKLVKAFCNYGVDINGSSYNALHRACVTGNYEMVCELIACGADTEVTCVNYGSTPLLYACQNGHLLIVKYLIQCGADVHAVNSSGNGVLHFAKNHEDILEYFRALDAFNGTGFKEIMSSSSMEVRHNELMRACSLNMCSRVEHLMMVGIDIGIRDSEGNTALGIICKKSCAKCLLAVLSRNPSLDEVIQGNGKSIWDSFVNNYDETCVNALIEYGFEKEPKNQITLIQVLIKNDECKSLDVILQKYDIKKSQHDYVDYALMHSASENIIILLLDHGAKYYDKFIKYPINNKMTERMGKILLTYQYNKLARIAEAAF